VWIFSIISILGLKVSEFLVECPYGQYQIKTVQILIGVQVGYKKQLMSMNHLLMFLCLRDQQMF